MPLEWTKRLREEYLSVGIDYITSPYDLKSTSLLAECVSSFKIGSGDITWSQMIRQLCTHQKPILLATGASRMQEVEYAVNICKSHKVYPVLMQCNTNYTGSHENFNHINLNVLKSYSLMFPEMELGPSDHTAGHATVLGAVALGARYIEKHLTLDNTLDGGINRPAGLGSSHTYDGCYPPNKTNGSAGRGMIIREGWANYEMARALGSRSSPRYRNTFRSDIANNLIDGIDFDTNGKDCADVAGSGLNGSESTVSTILWDFYDTRNDNNENLYYVSPHYITNMYLKRHPTNSAETLNKRIMRDCKAHINKNVTNNGQVCDAIFAQNGGND